MFICVHHQKVHNSMQNQYFLVTLTTVHHQLCQKLRSFDNKSNQDFLPSHHKYT